jgi:hypothetical protein
MAGAKVMNGLRISLLNPLYLSSYDTALDDTVQSFKIKARECRAARRTQGTPQRPRHEA